MIYTDEFANHEFFDEAVGRNESKWVVKTGEAQVEFWNTLLGGMFSKLIVLNNADDFRKHKGEVDAVLIPRVEELQYTIPLHTNIKVYEIWMRYGFRLAAIEDIHGAKDGGLHYLPDHEISDFNLTAYGKTPTAFLQSDETAVNLAAVVALRDAGVNFVTSFARMPNIASWVKGEFVQEHNHPIPPPDSEIPAPSDAGGEADDTTAVTSNEQDIEKGNEVAAATAAQASESAPKSAPPTDELAEAVEGGEEE